MKLNGPPTFPVNPLLWISKVTVSADKRHHHYIVSRKHYLVYLLIHLRLVLLDPCEFRSRKVARRIQKVRKAGLMSDGIERLLAIRDSTSVAPYYRWTQDISILVHTPDHASDMRFLSL